MKGYYDAKVRGVSFRPGDFVYRANDASHAEDTGKLGDQSGKDPNDGYGSTWKRSITSCGTWMERCDAPARGISAISRNAIFREVLTGISSQPHASPEVLLSLGDTVRHAKMLPPSERGMCAAPANTHNIALPLHTPSFLSSLMAWTSKRLLRTESSSFSSAKGLRMSRGQQR
ncbi:hypothetical protein Tco_0595766 [Tanacetum coccineum]